MALLMLDALPSRIGKGAILKFLIEQGGLDAAQVGAINVRREQAMVDIPDAAAGVVDRIDGAIIENRPIRAWLQTESVPQGEEDHFQRLMRLLRLEAEAEEQRMLEYRQQHSGAEVERTGLGLVNLVIRAEDAGLGGRILITLGKRQPQQPLPWNRLTLGTPVLLSEESDTKAASWRGVVSHQTKTAIQVALSDWPDTDNPTFRLDATSDEISRQRQQAALERVRIAKGDRLAELRRVLLREQAPSFGPEPDSLVWFNTLNEPQQAAVRRALATHDLALIHGPPGTGKTTTVVEIIRQALRRGDRVLACAPSNMAVDNMFERLLAAKEKVVRLGHPARVQPELRAYTLDALVENHPDMKQARKLKREAYALRTKSTKWRRAKPAPGEKREMRDEAKQMIADARRMEAQVVQRIIHGARVICATTTGLDSELLGQMRFDVCVIDEAGQGTEPSTWIPVLRSERVILAGDPFQLPPTVISKEAANAGFSVSLMERLIKHLDEDASRQLVVQYRMHTEIMTFSSQEFYNNSLLAHESVAGHRLCDLPGVTTSDLTETPVHFIDTAGAGYDETQEPGGESRLNPQEADLIVAKAQALLESGVPAADIAIITPYAAQVRHLRTLLDYDGLEIDTVDSFQGREKEAILISLVRSNPETDIGFLGDVRRINVALTRARRKLIVVGDSATIGAHPFYSRLIQYFEQIGAYHSVWEELY